MVKIFGSEFDRFESCTTAAAKKFGPYRVNIYDLQPPFIVPLGPIPLEFRKCAVYVNVSDISFMGVVK